MFGGMRFNMGMQQEGIEGEQKLGEYLKAKGIHYFQPDGIAIEDGKYIVYEVKNKGGIFKPPPFYGHGLELYQVKARLLFYEVTGVRCKFIVFDKENNKILSQWLDVLNDGNYFDTKNGIRIYPIENFDMEETVTNGHVLSAESSRL
jgi:hypothetical protein